MQAITITSEVQEPLVAAEIEFTSFTFVSFDIDWLTEGEISFLDGDGFKAAITLLAKSWKQKPAASLPDDDRLLAHLMGLGRGPAAMTEWLKVKDAALSDFVLCSDGRFYSRTLAPKALDAWEGVQKRKARTANATRARAENRRQGRHGDGGSATKNVTSNVTYDVTTNVSSTRGDQRIGEETRSEYTRPEEGGPLDRNAEPTSSTTQKRGFDAFEGRHISLTASMVESLTLGFPHFTDEMARHLREIDVEMGGMESGDPHAFLRRKLTERSKAAAQKVPVNASEDEPF